jgi:hypothetical protein
LPTTAFYGGAFATGFAIGTAARKLFVEAPASVDPTPVTEMGAQWVAAGDELFNTGDGSLYAPEMGLLASTRYYHWDPGCFSSAPPDAPASSGWEAITGTGPCPWAPYTPHVILTTRYFKAVAPSPPVPYTDQPTDTTAPWPSPEAQWAGLTPEQIKALMQDEIDDHPDRYPDLIAWLNFRLGVPGSQDPFSDDFTMPDCFNITVAACTTKVRALTGSSTMTLDTTTLSSDEAVMEASADRVTDTNPTAGAAVHASDALAVYVNPTTMPTMTTTDTSIADDLETDNEASVNSDNKKTIARTCRIRTQAAGLS